MTQPDDFGTLSPPSTAALRERIAAAIHSDLTTHKGRLDGGLLGIVPRLTNAVLAALPATDRPAVYAEVSARLTADAEQGAKPGLARIFRRSAAKQVQDWGRELAAESPSDVVVLCGSMRFAEQMTEAAITESVAGALVLKPDCNLKISHPLWADLAEAEALKVRLDDQHRQKIRIANRVLVVGDYIGDSTRAEIDYARKLGKPVAFTHPDVDPAPALANEEVKAP